MEVCLSDSPVGFTGLGVWSDNCVVIVDAWAQPAVKPEATAIGLIARWLLENNLNVRWAQVLRTEIQVFYVAADDMSLVIFGVTNHSAAASL